MPHLAPLMWLYTPTILFTMVYMFNTSKTSFAPPYFSLPQTK